MLELASPQLFDFATFAPVVFAGAATYSFIQAIERGGPHQTYAQVLAAMHTAIEHATGGPQPPGMDVAGMVLGLLLGGGVMSQGQTPVLSCDKQIDISNTRLLL